MDECRLPTVRTHVTALQSPLPDHAGTSPSSDYQVDSPKEHQIVIAKTLRDSIDSALASYNSTKNAAKAITRFSHIDQLWRYAYTGKIVTTLYI